MHFWLFWQNEVRFMGSSLDYGNGIALSNIWPHTHHSGFQLIIWKLRKYIFFEKKIGVQFMKNASNKNEFLITFPEVQLLQLKVWWKKYKTSTCTSYF